MTPNTTLTNPRPYHLNGKARNEEAAAKAAVVEPDLTDEMEDDSWNENQPSETLPECPSDDALFDMMLGVGCGEAKDWKALRVHLSTDYAHEEGFDYSLFSKYSLANAFAPENPLKSLRLLKAMEVARRKLTDGSLSLNEVLSDQASLDLCLLKIAEHREFEATLDDGCPPELEVASDRRHRRFLATCRTLNHVKRAPAKSREATNEELVKMMYEEAKLEAGEFWDQLD